MNECGWVGGIMRLGKKEVKEKGCASSTSGRRAMPIDHQLTRGTQRREFSTISITTERNQFNTTTYVIKSNWESILLFTLMGVCGVDPGRLKGQHGQQNSRKSNAPPSGRLHLDWLVFVDPLLFFLLSFAAVAVSGNNLLLRLSRHSTRDLVLHETNEQTRSSLNDRIVIIQVTQSRISPQFTSCTFTCTNQKLLSPILFLSFFSPTKEKKKKKKKKKLQF